MNMCALRLGFLAAASITVATGVSLHPAGAARQLPAASEEVIAEKGPGAPVEDDEDVASLDGRRVAWRVKTGQQWSVAINGIPRGAAYDEVRSLTFSSDGQHLAFAARRKDRWSIVVDEEEMTPAYADVGAPLFSPDATRIAVSVKPAKKWTVIVGDQQLAGEYDAVLARRFSPDGKRLAYVVRRGNKRFVVVDGKEGPPFDIVGGIVFSADSRRFAYAGAEVDQGFGKQKAVGRVVVDGVPGAEYEGSQVGGLLKNLATGSVTRLAVGYFSELVSGTHGVSAPVFSPDGSRVAYAARRGKNDHALILNGEPQHVLAEIVAGPVFSPDNRRTAIIASEEGACWLVVDGRRTGPPLSRELDFFSDLTFAPALERVAYVGVRGGSLYDQGYTRRAKRRVYVDGVAGAEFDALFLGRLLFSPDGSHLVYVVGGVSEGSREVAFVVTDDLAGRLYDDIFGVPGVDSEGRSVSYIAQSARRFLYVKQPLEQTFAPGR
jgi:Tol biopolymer transport system component